MMLQNALVWQSSFAKLLNNWIIMITYAILLQIALALLQAGAPWAAAIGNLYIIYLYVYTHTIYTVYIETISHWKMYL